MAKRRLFLCKHTHRWVKDKSSAAIHTPPPWPEPSSSRPHKQQGIQAQSNFWSLTTKPVYCIKEMHLCRCLSKTRPLDFSDVYVLFSRFLSDIWFVSNFYLCSALVVSAPVLFVPYCFLILCHFCFSSLPRFIQLVINCSIHAEFVVNKTFISVTRLSAVSLCLHICLPRLHFNDILCVSHNSSLFINFLFRFFLPSFNLGSGTLLSKNTLQSILMLLHFLSRSPTNKRLSV